MIRVSKILGGVLTAKKMTKFLENPELFFIKYHSFLLPISFQSHYYQPNYALVLVVFNHHRHHHYHRYYLRVINILDQSYPCLLTPMQNFTYHCNFGQSKPKITLLNSAS